MSTVGQLERVTQDRVVALFRDTLHYDYLGNWKDRTGNACIEPGFLRAWLTKQAVNEVLIDRALYVLDKAANDGSKSLYDRNSAVYDLLRYGVHVKPDVGENTQTVWLIDWKHPENNHFAIAEEVTVDGIDPKAHEKRPDVVLYVNGIALGVLELKRSKVSVGEGIRQNLDNQKKEFIPHFFATMQWVMAGNDTEGLRYGTIQTPEKHYLTWKEDSPIVNRLDRALTQVCEKARFLELIHDFVAFDKGTKKLCRPHQYFGVRAAQGRVRRREGGILWHTQGSGKSLTMVWLAKWIRENVTDARVLIITDRTELDEQIEGVFLGVNEQIARTTSGKDLIDRLNAAHPPLLCSLIHKFGDKQGGAKKPGGAPSEASGDATDAFIAEMKKSLPPDFKVKGDLYVFVDECHRTQSGELNKAMSALMPGAVFIGFTGTPLLKTDKKTSLKVFGGYIHTYKFHEAVHDGVVLDLRYEARDIDQHVTSQAKIDQWFEAKTKGLTDLARAQLKQRWGTLRKVLSSQSRLEKIVADVLMDMETRDRLKSGRGNALLVSGSIYQACKFYELFAKTELKGRCAIVTSYVPSAASIKGEESGEGLTERLRQYDIYKAMLANWFNEPAESAVKRVAEFEAQVKQKFVKEPGQMKLLIVVDKLLTGFDAPPATYLYLDKQMRDHGLFQAICRVNRLDGDDKEYGYIVDYKDLFKSLEVAVKDYTTGAFDGYDKADVEGLLEGRLGKARERLEEALDSLRVLCEPVEPPRDDDAYYRYFSSKESGDLVQLKANEPQRLKLYTFTSALVRAYANLAGEMSEAGYDEDAAAAIKKEVTHYESLRAQVKLHSGDAIDLKRYEPAMRHLIDTYISAEESEKVSEFDDLSLVELIVKRGAEAVGALPEAVRASEKTAAEVIENNVRRLIVDESPVNPKYYEKMSALLDALIAQRRADAVDYQKYLQEIVELTRQAKAGPSGSAYPETLDTPAKRALYDNLNRDEALALKVDAAVRASRQDDWRNHTMKTRKVKLAIRGALPVQDGGAVKKAEGPAHMLKEDATPYGLSEDEELLEKLLDLVKNQREY